MGPRRVLVTGCSSGIGLAVAARLAKDELRRFEVVATMRDLRKRGPLEKAAGDSLNKTLEIKQLDACCEASIRECVNSLPDRRISLQAHNDIGYSAVTVNNAGVGMIGPLECQSIDAMKNLFDTNFFGLARLVKELLPDMKRRQSGHIVVMSSVMGIQGAFVCVREIAEEERTTLVEPGPVVTEFERKVLEDAEKMDLSGTDEETAKIFREVYLPYSKKIFSSLGQTPEEQTIKVITAKEPPLRHQTNRLYMPMTALKHADPTGRLPLDTFYKMIFKHDSVFNATLGVLRMLQRGAGKK
ncbi:hypothetical protein FQN60_003938 [Etheostoma spectabile]|uniref:Retinol dehydrogenase n=1 Tax=Etheostoma spectabile TaxID=54343 RepID=A0A5J5CVS4_9PERO|nr:hypothetical protein FQN60_003938 [Etheostoma spectabile]